MLQNEGFSFKEGIGFSFPCSKPIFFFLPNEKKKNLSWKPLDF